MTSPIPSERSRPDEQEVELELGSPVLWRRIIRQTFPTSYHESNSSISTRMEFISKGLHFCAATSLFIIAMAEQQIRWAAAVASCCAMHPGYHHKT